VVGVPPPPAASSHSISSRFIPFSDFFLLWED
jgi:hypothetical protein